MIENTSGFTGCGKTLLCNRYGLQPVRKWLQTGPALAAEGLIPIPLPAFSAASLAPEARLSYPVSSFPQPVQRACQYIGLPWDGDKVDMVRHQAVADQCY